MMATVKLLLITACFATFSPTFLRAQQQWNLQMLSNWDDNSIPAASFGPYNECWGYTQNGMEFAFLGSSQGTYFFDVTDPYNIVLVDFYKTKDTTTLVVNKDYVTYSHYLYAVSDQGDNSLQIFDLQYLPDSVVLVYDDNAISKRCHTVFVENDRLYMCHNTRPDNSYGPMDIFSLANPVNPVLLGTVSHPNFFTTHEVFVKNDTAYCANGYDGLWIYNVANPAAASLITIYDIYPESGYNHSAWLTDDSQTMVFTDENHGRGVKIVDLSDIHDIQPLSIVRSNLLQVPNPLSSDGSIAHNPYIIGDILLLSYYHDGVQAFNIADPANPVLVAYYDTHPQSVDYYSYAGCWGLYPFLPSGNIIASDMSNGLFVLDGSQLLNIQPPATVNASITAGPNPVMNELQFFYTLPKNESFKVTLFDITGKLVTSKYYDITAGNGSIIVPVNSISSGIYVAKVSGRNLNLTTKFVKVNE